MGSTKKAATAWVRFFLRELTLCGVRVYEPEGFDRAIELVAGDELPLQQLITARRSLGDLQEILEKIGSGAEMMKVLVDAQRVETWFQSAT